MLHHLLGSLVPVWQIQAADLHYNTRIKYLGSMLAFSEHCSKFNLPWHSDSMAHWLPCAAVANVAKPLTATTLQQEDVPCKLFG